MPTFKLVLSDPETGRAETRDLKGSEAQLFVGVKIGGILDGDVIGLKGKIRVTGGSDRAGFAMRSDVLGGVKKRVLLTKGVGFRSGRRGERRRKMVRGNTVTEDTYQINAVFTK